MTAQLPAYLQKFAAKPSDLTESLASEGGGSYNRISTKGGKFHFIEKGEVKKTTKNEIYVTILGAEPLGKLHAKTFYMKPYAPGADVQAPDCSSSDGLRPDSWISKPQADRCHVCPHNEWGSAGNGSKGKRCKDSKRLYVVEPDKIEEGVIYIFSVPPVSLKSIGEVAKQVAASGAPLEAAIIKISFDDDAEVNIPKFEFAGYLDEEYGVKAIERASKKEWSNPERAKELPFENAAPAIEAPKKEKVIEAEVIPASKTEMTDEQAVAIVSGESVLDAWDD